MATKLKQMKGEEFVKKILESETDFTKIELEKNFNLNGYDGSHERFKEIQDYFKNKKSLKDIQESSLILNFSDFSYIKARDLFLPYLNAEGTNFTGADFMGAHFLYIDFRDANLTGADLGFARLWGGDFERAIFIDTNLWGADLWLANLKYAKNLEDAKNLDSAHFLHTKVTELERIIIERALLNKEYFIVEKSILS